MFPDKEFDIGLPVDYRTLSPKNKREVRMEYIRQQDGRCYHCAGDLEENPPDWVAAMPVNRNLFPPRFFDWPVHLHHSHETGLTIGAVHCYCNSVLWQYFGE